VGKHGDVHGGEISLIMRSREMSVTAQKMWYDGADMLGGERRAEVGLATTQLNLPEGHDHNVSASSDSPQRPRRAQGLDQVFASGG